MGCGSGVDQLELVPLEQQREDDHHLQVWVPAGQPVRDGGGEEDRRSLADPVAVHLERLIGDPGQHERHRMQAFGLVRRPVQQPHLADLPDARGRGAQVDADQVGYLAPVAVGRVSVRTRAAPPS
jgi:hypothetical protein